MRTRVGVVVLIACAACASLGWQHPSKPSSALPQDEYECEKESAALYPPVFDLDRKDLNEGNRRGMRISCLQARGWR